MRLADKFHKIAVNIFLSARDFFARARQPIGLSELSFKITALMARSRSLNPMGCLRQYHIFV